MYTIAFAIMQIPSNLIALKIQPRVCIMICEIGWTIFTWVSLTTGCWSFHSLWIRRVTSRPNWRID